MNIKKSELLALWKVLGQLTKEKHPIKFSYFIAKNRSIIKDEIEILSSLAKPDERYVEFDSKRAQLANELSDKDESGNPKVEDGNYVVIERQHEFEKGMDILKAEYKDAINNQEKKINEYKSILNDDYDFEGYKISLDKLPDKIAPELIEVFMQMELIDE